MMKENVEQREQEILRGSLALIRRELSPQRIYLFGSRAKRPASSGADFDFAVEGPVPPEQKKMELREVLNASAGLYSVDIVFLNEIDSDFRTLIIETGKLLYDETRG